MTHTIEIAALTYTWQGGKYADVKHAASVNAHEEVEVELRTEVGFMVAAMQHAAQRMSELQAITETLDPDTAYEMVPQDGSVLPRFVEVGA